MPHTTHQPTVPHNKSCNTRQLVRDTKPCNTRQQLIQDSRQNIAQDTKPCNSKRKKVAYKQSPKDNIRSSTVKREKLKRSVSQDHLFDNSSHNGQVSKLEDKSFFVRTRRHSDSILLEEKINPYFTKNYKDVSQHRVPTHRTISPVKARPNINNLISPKRSRSNTSLASLSKTLASPPKRSKGDNIFDFQYNAQGFAKPSPPDTYSYNLLEGELQFFKLILVNKSSSTPFQ